jgi:uncharacterized membrane protein
MDIPMEALLGIALGIGLAAAGVVASASVMTDVPPYVLWPVAIIAGGGIAGLTKGGAALVRAKTGLATAGVVALLVWTVRRAGSILFRSRPPTEPGD